MNFNKIMTEESRPNCSPDCPMHSLSRKNACVYESVHELAPIGHYQHVEYDQPCKHPEFFKPIIIRASPEGKLVPKLL
jgi:hypothetical protein